jgi:hypothetical protein
MGTQVDCISLSNNVVNLSLINEEIHVESTFLCFYTGRKQNSIAYNSLKKTLNFFGQITQMTKILHIKIFFI